MPAGTFVKAIASHLKVATSGISPAKAAIRRDLARFKLKTDLLLSPLCPQISDLFLKDLTFPASGVEEFKRGLSSADLDQISLLASPASS